MEKSSKEIIEIFLYFDAIPEKKGWRVGVQIFPLLLQKKQGSLIFH